MSPEFNILIMEPEIQCEDGVEADTDEGVSFSQVSAVVTRWTLDFLFASLCRRFKEGRMDEFDQILSTFEGKTDFTRETRKDSSEWDEFPNK